MEKPDLFRYSNYRDFFVDFININKKINPRYSRRYWAKKLGWPAAYIDQIISGKKALSIRRCIEFSRMAEFDEFSLEKLILLALKENKNESVKEYAQKRWRQETSAYFDKKDPIIVKPIEAYYLIAAFEIIRQFDHVPNYSELKNSFKTFDVKTLKKVEIEIQRLCEYGFIKISPAGKISVQRRELVFTCPPEMGWEEWRKFFCLSFQSAVRSTKSDQRHYASSHGFGYLPKDRMHEVKQKIFVLREWMSSLGPSLKEPFDKDEFAFVQYCFSIFPTS